MKITPYIVDHSAYNSFMLLIEAEGKKVLHTGDFRNHGYKGVILEKTLKEIGKIDALITEGTTLSREQIKSKTEKEWKIPNALNSKVVGVFLPASIYIRKRYRKD